MVMGSVNVKKGLQEKSVINVVWDFMTSQIANVSILTV